MKAFDDQHASLTLSDVARIVGLPRASARRALLTLQSLGYVENSGRLFSLSPQVLTLARAYLDQLERSNGLASARIAATRTALASAEGASGAARSTALSTLATQLNTDASSASDRAKVQKLATAVSDLASAR